MTGTIQGMMQGMMRLPAKKPCMYSSVQLAVYFLLNISTMWGPKIAELVNIATITVGFMVLMTS